MAAILRARDVSIDAKPAVQSPQRLSRHVCGEVRPYAFEEGVVEGLVDEPVNVVREDAGCERVGGGEDGRVGSEADGGAGGGDGVAFLGGEDVGEEEEIGDCGVRVFGDCVGWCWERNCVGVAEEEEGRVEIWWFAGGTGGRFDELESCCNVGGTV